MDHITPERALLSARLFWGIFLGGQLFLVLIILKMWNAGVVPAIPSSNVHLLFYITLALTLTLLPLGMFLRNQTYKKHWRGHAIAPQGYLSGNILLLGLCEIVSIAGLLTALVSQHFWPAALPSALAIAMQALNFPTGAPMRPTQ